MTTEHFSDLTRRHHNPEVRRTQKMLIGPWAHPLSAPFRSDSKLGDFDYGKNSIVALDKEAVRWFDYWLKGIPNGIAEEPPVRVFLMGANKWMDCNEFPVSNTLEKTFYLAANGPANTLHGKGLLSDKHGTLELSTFIYDPSDPAPSPFWKESLGQPGTNNDLRNVQRRKDVLVFTSKPVSQPLDVIGMLYAQLFVSTSARDTDFVTRLSDVGPNGYVQRLQHGILRLRYRDGYEKSLMVEPDEIVEIKVEMLATAHRFKRSHRVRLDLTSSAFPAYAPNFNTGQSAWDESEPVKAKQTVYHSERYPSRLVLPVLEHPKFASPWTHTRWNS